MTLLQLLRRSAFDEQFSLPGSHLGDLCADWRSSCFTTSVSSPLEKQMSIKRSVALSVGATAVALVSSSSALAYATFFGYDPTPTPGLPATYSNSVSAETQFLSNLVGVGTENFESYAAGTTAPINLTFPGAGTATLNASSGVVSGTSGSGRFATSGSKYWSINVTAGTFNLVFGSDVAAFGFYGTDLGDFGGNLTLRLTLSGGGTTDVAVPYTPSLADGNALYFGLIAGNAAETFTRIDFLSTGGFGNETFGYDDMTIGSLQQVIPEPGSISLVAGALLGLGWLSRRRKS